MKVDMYAESYRKDKKCLQKYKTQKIFELKLKIFLVGFFPERIKVFKTRFTRWKVRKFSIKKVTYRFREIASILQ